MTSFKSLCEEYYGTSDFYEVLQIKRDATEKEVKKAYHKLSLLVHPDRVDEHHKKYATEKFKILSKIHSILQDKSRREIYDESGDIDDENDSDFNWMDYWRSIFKPITIKDIKKYEEEYIGSDTEIRDIKKAYESSKGDMDKMLELIPFSNCENEERFRNVIRKLIDEGELEEYPGFFNEPAAKKKKRHNKWKKEQELSESIDMEALERDMKKKSEQRAENLKNLISNLEAKYGEKNSKRKSITSGKEPQQKKRRTTRK